LKLEGHSESANLRQRYVNFFRCVRQMAARYSALSYLAVAKDPSIGPLLS